MPHDKFALPFFYPTKSGGFFYEMNDNPKNDQEVDWPSEVSFSGGGVVVMHPNGPTDFGIGKNIASFNDSIGGCNMDFAATAKRGYAYKADDARDIEFKCLMKPTGINSGFSISFCTGHHTGSNCCQGFAYMFTTELNDNPSTFRFRKETVHVSYEDSPEGTFTHSKCNFKINGIGRYVGIGACRYNKPSSGGTSPQDDTVILEGWFNPNPDDDPSDWTMIKRIEDKPGNKWTSAAGKCNGDSDQIGPWSGAQNRMKTNATSGSISFKSVSLREINPFGTFEEPPPPPADCGAGFHRDSSGACVPDTVDCGPGKHQDASGNCVDDEGPNPGPTEPTKVKGIFVLKRDINIYRTDACEGSTGGGGSGGKAKFFGPVAANFGIELSDTSAWSFRTRAALLFKGMLNGQYSKILKQLDVSLKKVGSPAASPVITAVIWNATSIVYTSPTNLDPTTLTTSFAEYSFDFSANTHTFQIGDRVGIRYFADSSTSDVNYVVAGYDMIGVGNTTMVQYESSVWHEHTDRDLACTLWE